MTNRTNLEIEDNKLFIAEERWNDLQRVKGSASFASVISTVEEFLKRDGAFMIYNLDGEIMRRFDRLSEFEKFMGETND